jgi:hypothetical protein
LLTAGRLQRLNQFQNRRWLLAKGQLLELVTDRVYFDLYKLPLTHPQAHRTVCKKRLFYFRTVYVLLPLRRR